jgi:hypothetical protein
MLALRDSEMGKEDSGAVQRMRAGTCLDVHKFSGDGRYRGGAGAVISYLRMALLQFREQIPGRWTIAAVRRRRRVVIVF